MHWTFTGHERKQQDKTSYTDHSFHVIFSLHKIMVHYCNAAECKSYRFKAKKLDIYPFMADMMWVKWLKDL